MEMTIRVPRHEDIEVVVDLGASMHQESAYAFLPFDRDKVRKLFTSYVTSPEIYGGFVADDNGILAGMIGGYISDYFFCDEKVACDMVLFVDPRYRGGRTALRLLRAFRQWAVEQGAQELCLGVSTNVNTASTGRLYEAMGMTHVGGLYKARLNSKEAAA